MTEAATKRAPASPGARGLREAVTSAVGNGSLWQAVQAARLLLEADSGAGTLRFLSRLVQGTPQTKLALREVRVGLLSSFSIEFARDALVALGLASGLRIEIYQAPFGSFRQEILDSASGLYAFAPHAVVLAVESGAWLPMDAPQGASADALLAEVASLAAKFRARSSAALLCHNIPLPRWPAPTVAVDAPSLDDLSFVTACNAGLRMLAAESADFYVVDYAALVNRVGHDRWFDDRMRLYARAPVAQANYAVLAREYVKFARGLVGLTRKCLVVDLDNTLWGGILGEDGIDGVRLGADYPGSAFVEFQHFLARLQARGVILAIASKNNPGDVEQMFSQHPFMVLKAESFSSRQVGWQPKSESLMAIARDLNIGLEHIVFVDDSTFECEHVREALPEVTVIQLPAEPADYVSAISRDGWFDALSLSSEDRRRGELYKQRDLAESIRSTASNLEDFYRQLGMEITIAPVNDASRKRTAQLTQKTNQFNVTTRRYTEAEIERIQSDPLWTVCTVAVRDKFGDNGIVGVILAVERGDALEIDTLLLSCRVIGRTVETAMLACLCDVARRRGCSKIVGSILPTDKNAPVRDLFRRHGFQDRGSNATSAGAWELALSRGAIAYPPWFRLEISEVLTPASNEGQHRSVQR